MNDPRPAASPWWFWLDWHEAVTESDPTAPKPEPGQPMPTRTRRVEVARRVGAETQGGAERLRAWHLANDSWIPPGAIEPNVSDIQTRNR